jgi:tRNA(Ile2) C34 agmatinyltransferase TiaS
MILVGIDDTDLIDTPGTNQLARHLAKALAANYECRLIVRHQLLEDPRIPFTSHNGSASLWLDPLVDPPAAEGTPPTDPWLLEELRRVIREWSPAGSDPGLCIAWSDVASEVSDYGRKCQSDVVTQQDARELAARQGLHLEGLGGTEGGVIGALAAVGLAATADDGRVVYDYATQDELGGPQAIERLMELGIEVRRLVSQEIVKEGTIDLGEKLRPNLRGGRIVLYAAQGKKKDQWIAFRVP